MKINSSQLKYYLWVCLFDHLKMPVPMKAVTLIGFSYFNLIIYFHPDNKFRKLSIKKMKISHTFYFLIFNTMQSWEETNKEMSSIFLKSNIWFYATMGPIIYFIECRYPSRGFAFSRCLNGTFPWRKCSVKALESELRREDLYLLLFSFGLMY